MYYLAGGFALATITWSVANKLLHTRSPAHHMNGEHTAVVDWPFCFDIHCNAMVPLVALLGGMLRRLIFKLKYMSLLKSQQSILSFLTSCFLFHFVYVGVQLMLCPILLLNSRLSAALSYLVYATGISQYCYVTFLGFAQRNVDKPETFLYPLAAVAVTAPIVLLGGLNPTKHMLQFFFGYT